MDKNMEEFLNLMYQRQTESIVKTGSFYVWLPRKEEHQVKPRQIFTTTDGIKFVAHSFDYDDDMTGVTFRRV